MLMLRWLVLLLLLSAAVSFVCFVVTGQARFRRQGLRILKWTGVGALGFFGVLLVEKLT